MGYGFELVPQVLNSSHWPISPTNTLTLAPELAPAIDEFGRCDPRARTHARIHCQCECFCGTALSNGLGVLPTFLDSEVMSASQLTCCCVLTGIPGTTRRAIRAGG